MSCSVLHHVEVCVKDEYQLVQLLTKGFGFRPFARRLTPLASKWVLRSGDSIFVVTKRNNQTETSQNGTSDPVVSKTDLHGTNKKEEDCDRVKSAVIKNAQIKELNDKSDRTLPLKTSPNFNITGCNENINSDIVVEQCKEHWTVFCCRDKSTHTIDSVFNVALAVKNVDLVTNKVRSLGGQVLQEPTDICDDLGRVRYSIVTSCCGNVVHTLIDKKNYEGHFLPGFEKLSHDDSITKNLRNETGGVSEQCPLNSIDTLQCQNDPRVLTYVDHVTYVLETGTSHDLITWYEHCFGMKRFFTNR